MRAFLLLTLFAGASLAETAARRHHPMITAAPLLAARQAGGQCDAGETACTDSGCCPSGSPCTTSAGLPVCGGAGGGFCATTCPDGLCCGIGKTCTTDDSGVAACAGGFGAIPSIPNLSFSDDSFSDTFTDDFTDTFTDSNPEATTGFGGGSGGGGNSAGGGGNGGFNGGSTPTKTIHQGQGSDASHVASDGVWGLIMLQAAAIVGVAAFVL